MHDSSVPVIFGEVLYDCFPDGNRVLGGAPFNVAWHCHAFGLNPLFISSVGNDQQGIQIRNAMKQWGMNTDGLQMDNEHATGVVDIQFIDGEPVYDIVENSAWDFINIDSLPEIDTNSMLYHGSLAMRNDVSAATIEHIIKDKQPSVFVDINLRKPWWNQKNINNSIADCRWLKLNQHELRLITAEKNNIETSISTLLKKYKLDLIVVTQGEDGVMVADSNGKMMNIAPEKAITVVDTVGAGDSFSSVLLLGLYKNWPLKTTIERAQHFACSIVGVQGATVNDKSFYQPFIDEWQLAV